MESRLVGPRGYTMAWIRFSGVRGKGWLRMVTLPLELLVAFWQSAKAIFAHRPDAVLGMGGYVSFPGGLMASFLNRPLAVHEQNAVPGLANRVLARLADRVLSGFPGAFGSAAAVIWTGNPVRQDIATLPAPEERYAARAGGLRLLVVGGSQGAQILNTVVPEALALLPAATRPVVTHQTGEAHRAAVVERYRRHGIEADVVAFIDDMARRYAEADLIICRAGASTIAELAAAGVASVLVPFPHAVDDHQSANAGFLAGRGAALMIPQRDFSAQRLSQVLAGCTRGDLMAMAQKARAAAKPDATREVAEICLALAKAA
jgi:UDP-N-acetylglucosamine--N-acetylmuramyl-(pentapeptide) pyrophosphoryl-undecaprenol N-acetylglucosamine transferase